jgi:hypothetical protein
VFVEIENQTHPSEYSDWGSSRDAFRTQSMDEPRTESPDGQNDEQGHLSSILSIGCLWLFLSPLIAFIGAMRWNITQKLDADLAFILTWFCDTSLLFLILFPVVSAYPNNILTRKLYAIAEVKLMLTVGIFYLLLVIAFVFVVVIAFHNLMVFLFAALGGKG